MAVTLPHARPLLDLPDDDAVLGDHVERSRLEQERVGARVSPTDEKLSGRQLSRLAVADDL
jgi:hypothetical protein